MTTTLELVIVGTIANVVLELLVGSGMVVLHLLLFCGRGTGIRVSLAQLLKYKDQPIVPRLHKRCDKARA